MPRKPNQKPGDGAKRRKSSVSAEAVAYTSNADRLVNRAIPQPTTEPAALWQLLLAANPIAHNGIAQTAGNAAAGEITTAKNIDVIGLIRRKKIVTATVDPATVPVDPGFDRRLCGIMRAVPRGPVQERLVRWEIMRLCMCYDVLVHGCMTDTTEGREVRIPLVMTRGESAKTSFATRQTDLRFQRVEDPIAAAMRSRADAINHPVVQSELFRIWGEITLRGGITLPSYFGLCKALFGALLPHLSERELHQLITTEVELDLPDQQADTDPMTRPQFLRWVGVLALIWMESHAVAEALTFVQHVGAILLLPIESVDMQFAERYGRKDPSLLVPLVPARVCNGGEATVLLYAREQLAISVKVRFGSLLSDAPVTAKPRIKKRQRHVAGRSVALYMAPEMEEDTMGTAAAATYFEDIDVSKLRDVAEDGTAAGASPASPASASPSASQSQQSPNITLDVPSSPTTGAVLSLADAAALPEAVSEPAGEAAVTITEGAGEAGEVAEGALGESAFVVGAPFSESANHPKAKRQQTRDRRVSVLAPGTRDARRHAAGNPALASSLGPGGFLPPISAGASLAASANGRWEPKPTAKAPTPEPSAAADAAPMFKNVRRPDASAAALLQRLRRGGPSGGGGAGARRQELTTWDLKPDADTYDPAASPFRRTALPPRPASDLGQYGGVLHTTM